MIGSHTARVLLAAVLLAALDAAPAHASWQWVNPQPTGNFVLGLTYGGGQFVAVDDAGMVETSPDGVAWAAHYSGALYAPEDIVWDGGQYVMVGWNGEILTSPDAVAWTLQDSGTSEILWAIAWNGSELVAVGG
ncbi:MAG TPA: hypothetical protein VJ696_00800, partial [Rhodanobacteraceae bacterium]|nr:hypothetical protein [Rhodanobacteraceae bacterium]